MWTPAFVNCPDLFVQNRFEFYNGIKAEAWFEQKMCRMILQKLGARKVEPMPIDRY